MGRTHGASRDILLLLLFHVENMWSQCVSAPSVEVCISLRVYAASCTTPLRPSPPPFPLHLFSLIFSACRSRGLFSRKDATSVHRCTVTFRPSFLQNESIGRSLYDERRDFPVGTRAIFFEKISGILFQHRENKFLPSPLHSVSEEETDFISFQQGRTDFQSLLTANRFIASFFLTDPIFENWRTRPDQERKYRDFARTFIPRNWSLVLFFASRFTRQIKT